MVTKRSASKSSSAPHEAARRTPEDAARDAAIADELGAWFDASARDLPWRRTRDPYAIWISEVMLQQTRVDTVIPYYQRFLARYPTVRDLASAELDGVLSSWSGLGYYSRARSLHAAAREVTERYGGALPADAAELRSLRGVGAYTAGAIASIAFGRREPLVDGNVARVLARLEGIDDDVRSPAGSKRLWGVAARLVPIDRPGRFNEALMELGAMVCTPREPRCDACPVRARCAAAAAGRQRELPIVGGKRPPTAVSLVAAVVRRGERALLGRRPEGGLFGGLWEPPMVEAASLAEAAPALAALGVEPTALAVAAGEPVRHVLSHRELSVIVAVGEAREGDVAPVATGAYERLAWVDLERDDVGVSTLARKVLAVTRDPRKRVAAGAKRPSRRKRVA
jgi:A/G-specific adenine glycosylase